MTMQWKHPSKWMAAAAGALGMFTCFFGAGILYGAYRWLASDDGASVTTSSTTSGDGQGGSFLSRAKGKSQPARSPDEIAPKLRQIGLAWSNMESQIRRFAPAKESQLSWRVHLLPYLDQGPLYSRFRLDEPWDSPHNLTLVPFMPEVFDLDGNSDGKTRIQVPVGQDMIFGSTIEPKYPSITDGNLNTLISIVVGPDKATIWTKPDDLQVKPDSPIASLGNVPEDFLSGITVGAEPVFFLPDLSPFDFYAMLTPRGGEVVDVAKKFARFKESSKGRVASKSSKESAPKVQSSSNGSSQWTELRKKQLLEVGLATLNYESAFKVFPIVNNPNNFDSDMKPKLSWRVHILRYLNHEALFQKFHMDEPWDSPHNLQLLQEMPDVFRDPADPIGTNKTRLVRLTGDSTPFREKGSGPVLARIPDGLGSTLMLISAGSDKAVSWTKPEDLPFDDNAPIECLGKLDSPLILGVFFDLKGAWFDAAVPPEIFKCYVTHDGQEVIGTNRFLTSGR